MINNHTIGLTTRFTKLEGSKATKENSKLGNLKENQELKALLPQLINHLKQAVAEKITTKGAAKDDPKDQQLNKAAEQATKQADMTAEHIAHFLMGKQEDLPAELKDLGGKLTNEIKDTLYDLLRTHRYFRSETAEKTLAKLSQLQHNLYPDQIDQQQPDVFISNLKDSQQNSVHSQSGGESELQQSQLFQPKSIIHNSKESINLNKSNLTNHSQIPSGLFKSALQQDNSLSQQKNSILKPIRSINFKVNNSQIQLDKSKLPENQRLSLRVSKNNIWDVEQQQQFKSSIKQENSNSEDEELQNEINRQLEDLYQSNNSRLQKSIANLQMEQSGFEIITNRLYTPKMTAIAEELTKNNILIPPSSHVDAKQVNFVVSKQTENQYIGAIKNLFAGAKHSIGLSSLSAPSRTLNDPNAPESGLKKGTYYHQFIESITAVAEKNKSRSTTNQPFIPISMVFGNAPTILGCGVEFDPKAYLEALMKDLPQELHQFVKLEISAFNPQCASWNHSKIIVVDNTVNVGGINLFEEYNASENRPRDLALTIEDSEQAEAARNFIQDLAAKPAVNLAGKQVHKGKLGFTKLIAGKFTHFNPKIQWNGKEFLNAMDQKVKNYKNVEISIPKQVANKNVAKEHNVMSVPTFGLVESKLQPSEVIALAIIKNAKSSLKISQQSILFMYGGKVGDKLKGTYSHQIMDEITKALARGVKVEILVSGENCKADNGNDYNGMPIEQLRKNLLSTVDAKNCENLHIGNTRNHDGRLVPNHTKLVMADDEIFTIGSHNSYDKSHAEYTQLVEDKEIAQNLLAEYWALEWENAQKMG